MRGWGGGGLRIELRGGPFCRSVLASGTLQPQPQPQLPSQIPLEWRLEEKEPTLVTGDIRLLVLASNGQRVLISHWLHTAFLPLPAEAIAAAGLPPRVAGRSGEVGGGVLRSVGGALLGALLSAEGCVRGDGGGGGGGVGWHGLVARRGPLRGTAFFPKAALDKACKDKKCKQWRENFSLQLEYELMG